MAKKTNDLSHTKWMCKYHIVFTPKYRRKIIYNQYKADIRDILNDPTRLTSDGDSTGWRP